MLPTALACSTVANGVVEVIVTFSPLSYSSDILCSRSGGRLGDNNQGWQSLEAVSILYLYAAQGRNLRPRVRSEEKHLTLQGCNLRGIVGSDRIVSKLVGCWLPASSQPRLPHQPLNYYLPGGSASLFYVIPEYFNRLPFTPPC